MLISPKYVFQNALRVFVVFYALAVHTAWAFSFGAILKEHYRLDPAPITTLMQQSGLLKPDETLEHLYPDTSSEEKVVGYLLDFVEKTQKAWVGRGQKERWEVAPPAWLDLNSPVKKALLRLNLSDKQEPLLQGKKRHAWCIFGSLYFNIEQRIRFSVQYMKNHPQTILLLGGERPAGSPQDGTPETLNALKASLKVEQLTEQDLLREICGKVLQDVKRKGDVIHDLDVPRKELPRPTTESTLVFLMNWLKKRSDITSITFVSSQPHIGYQRALVEQARLLYGGVQSFEVVGPYYKVEKGAELQSLKRLVEGLGAFIWAQTPLVMHQLKLAPYEFEAHQERMKILYKPDSFGDRILTQLSQKKSVKKEK